MPRRQREIAAAQVYPSRSMVASATRYDGKAARIYNSQAGNWQAECYRHYEICGEARFSAVFFGHALSKAQLYVTDAINDPRAERLTSGPAFDALEELFHSSEGRAAMLSSIGIHFTVAGECYLIGRTDALNNDIWEIRSVLEVKSNSVTGPGEKWWIEPGGGQPNIELTDKNVVIRLWMPLPSRSIEADSPFRSLLPILEEIEWLTRYVFAQTSSRLAGAGILFVDEAIDFPPPPDAPEASRNSTADNLMRSLGNAMLKPMEDPSNPAAKVPTVVTVPGDSVDKIKWQTFWSELDSEAKSLRGEAIQRFALGMDLPLERILGMSSNMGSGGGKSNGVSHWGAWQIDEDTIKMHVEPMLDVVCNGITLAYLRPVSEDELAAIGYDTSALRLRPDRSAESLEMYDRALVGPKTALRENGFDPDTDAMTPEELQQWLLVKVASGSATPEMVSEAASQLGVSVPITDLNAQPGNESRPTPSMEDHPNRDIPDPTESEAASLVAANALVFRALERAGNRLRQSGVRPEGVPSYETHTKMSVTETQAKEALKDAWSCAEHVLVGHHEPQVKVLDQYATAVLTSGQPHTKAALKKWLTHGP